MKLIFPALVMIIFFSSCGDVTHTTKGAAVSPLAGTWVLDSISCYYANSTTLLEYYEMPTELTTRIQFNNDTTFSYAATFLAEQSSSNTDCNTASQGSFTTDATTVDLSASDPLTCQFTVTDTSQSSKSLQSINGYVSIIMDPNYMTDLAYTVSSGVIILDAPNNFMGSSQIDDGDFQKCASQCECKWKLVAL